MKEAHMKSLEFLSLSTLSLICSTIVSTSVADISAIDIAQADFAISLFRSSSSPTNSTFISPFSVASALTIPYVGSEGETYTQMRHLLAQNASDNALEEYFNVSTNVRSERESNFQFTSANKLYLKNGLVLCPRFSTIIHNKYPGSIEQVDFGQPEVLAKEINEWVEQKTESRIRNLVKAEMLSESSLMVIINAVFFKAKWRNAFVKKDNTVQDFYENEHRNRRIEMMTKDGGFPYYEDDKVQLIGLAYEGQKVFMYVFLPREKFALADFERSLNGSRLLELIHNCKWFPLHVVLPKFEIERELELSDALQRMGLKNAFTRAANFSAITQSEELFISKVVHKAFIKVNENGTEAVAGTALMLYGDRLSPPHMNFIADHPFLFVILNRNQILFMGRFH